jgi:hypothetical protein
MYNFAELTVAQKNALQAIVDKYADVEGSYESTMLGGIVHGYCDSGILTDAYSVECAERINKYFTEDAQYEGYLELFNTFIEEVEGRELLCCIVMREITDVCDTELGAAYIGKLTGTITERCYTE